MINRIDGLILLTQDERLVELCKKYWEIGDDGGFLYSAASLAKQSGTSSQKKFAQLISQSCKVHIQGFTCSSCGKRLSVSTRTEYEEYVRGIERGTKYVCSDCTQTAEKQKAERAEQERQDRIRIIREYYSQIEIPPIDIQNLSLEEAVYLLSVIRAGANENYSAIRPLELFETRLSPQEKYDYDIVRTLFYAGQLFIHPDSSPDAFTPFVEGKIDKIYIGRVMWLWRPTTDDGERKEPWRLAAEIENVFRTGKWPKRWIDSGEHIGLWKKVALSECFAYLQHSLEQHQMSFQPGDKTTQTFFSTAKRLFRWSDVEFYLACCERCGSLLSARWHFQTTGRQFGCWIYSKAGRTSASGKLGSPKLSTDSTIARFDGFAGAVCYSA